MAFGKDYVTSLPWRRLGPKSVPGEHCAGSIQASLLVLLCWSQFLNVFSALLHIPGLPGKVFSGKKAFMAMLDELLTEHKMTRDSTQPPRDLTDAFLAEVEKVIGSRRGYGLASCVSPSDSAPKLPGHNGRLLRDFLSPLSPPFLPGPGQRES